MKSYKKITTLLTLLRPLVPHSYLGLLVIGSPFLCWGGCAIRPQSYLVEAEEGRLCSSG